MQLGHCILDLDRPFLSKSSWSVSFCSPQILPLELPKKCVEYVLGSFTRGSNFAVFVDFFQDRSSSGKIAMLLTLLL